ncbi:MAG: tetratricopeptide repeat protein [Patescibacteria group bacterium]
MSSTFLSKFIASILLLVIAAGWYYGTYLPFRKSQLLILSIQGANAAKSLSDFKDSFSASLDFYSPVGQSESVKHMTNTVFNIVNQLNIPAEGLTDLIGFVEKYSRPILQAKQGDGLTQQFYVSGDLYRAAGFKYNNPEYLKKAEETYKEGLTLSPKRPQFLYGLLQIYLQANNIEGANETMKKILEYWPNDPEIQKMIKK